MTGLRLDLPPDAPCQILCLGAHADDIEIGCGGTLLTLLEAYADVAVRWVVFSATPRRRQEAQASADRFLRQARAATVDVLDFRDGYFPSEGAALKEHVQALAGRVSPDLIFTHHRADRHQDHRLLAELTGQAFRDHLILEYEIPKYDGDLGRPNVYSPLTEATARQKVDGLMDGFASQHARPWFSEETFYALLRLRGVEARSRYAEAFHSRTILFR